MNSAFILIVGGLISAQVIAPLVFVSFFVGLGVVYAFADVRWLKRGFLSGLLGVLLLVNLVGLPAYPVPELHKFSEPDEQTETFFDARVVTDGGNEVYLDSQAVRPARDPHIRGHAGSIARGEVERESLSCYFLQQANQYRRSIASGGPSGKTIPFPPHTLEQHWNRGSIDETQPFTRLRIYEITIRTSTDGSRITNKTSDLAYVYDASMEENSCEI